MSRIQEDIGMPDTCKHVIWQSDFIFLRGEYFRIPGSSLSYFSTQSLHHCTTMPLTNEMYQSNGSALKINGTSNGSEHMNGFSKVNGHANGHTNGHTNGNGYLNGTSQWHPGSWRGKPIKQQPIYEDQQELSGVLTQLKSYP